MAKQPDISWAEVKDLQEFDSPKWQAQLERLTPKEVERAIKSNAYEPVLERVIALRETVKERFAEREEIIDALFAAAVAQIPTVLIGPPGVAKGNIIRCLCEGLGLSARAHTDAKSGSTRPYFEYQLTRYTTPEEIFGPVHVQDLVQKQAYYRLTRGYLPEAQLAFLDEIFKSSSAILNTLLSILQERVFYNGGVAHPVPLIMVFAASNEPPEEKNLEALYDRFPIRITCPRVTEAALEDRNVNGRDVPGLLSVSWQQAFDRRFNLARVAVPQMSCANDLRLLHLIARMRFGGRSGEDGQFVPMGTFKQEFMRCYKSLRNECLISDRTMNLLWTYALCHALLNRHDPPGAAELSVFRHAKYDPDGELRRLVHHLMRRYHL